MTSDIVARNPCCDEDENVVLSNPLSRAHTMDHMVTAASALEVIWGLELVSWLTAQ